MENVRFALIIAFAMLSILLWQAWQIDYGPKTPVSVVEQSPATKAQADLPIKSTDSDTNSSANNPVASALPVTQGIQGKAIKVKTDVLTLEIDTQGGTLGNLALLKYPVDKKNTSVTKLRSALGFAESEKNLAPVKLFNTQSEDLFLAQSGLIATNNSASAANHHSLFNATADSFTLTPGQTTLVIPLTWSDNQGLSVTKTFTFTRGSYAIKVEQKIANNSVTPWSGRQYTQFIRTPYVDPTGNSFIRTYAGGVVYSEENKYQKVDYSQMLEEDLSLTTVGGWSAMIQHYFASAWILPANQENHLYSKTLDDNKFILGAYSPVVSVAPNTEAHLSAQLFAGPKIQPMLEKVAKGLDLTVDYGWLTFIAKYIYQLLNFIHGFIGNWGFAILGVTLFIKLLFFPLSAASYKSMAKMRKIQPRLKELQERYADNRQLFNQKMMALYKDEGVNPLGGCLPILVQIPVFISLYWVLVETVELRQAPFALWIEDLSAQDPYYILPILYGITMKIQQGLNPPPIDPIQAKVMKMFPIIFTFFFLFFPSGLVLYWIMNNTLSIIQQWYITKHIIGEDKVSA